MSSLLGHLIDACAATIVEHTDELTTLDQAVGDGDHGLNMKRGFEAVALDREATASLDPGGALQKAGMTLVMKVGGASGPLYGSLLIAMGKAMSEPPQDVGDVARALAAGVEAVKARGKSHSGEKTMLDVLVPVAGALAEADGLRDAIERVPTAADRGLESTRDMKATKGRASFLGERSIGHLDPGARSSQLLVHAVCHVFKGETGG